MRVAAESIAAKEPELRKSDRTRIAILDAALEFLWTKPFRALTVAELMTIAGASRSTFYQYFHDLHELMEALLEGLKHSILEVANPWLTSESNVIEELHRSLEGLVEVCHAQGPILRAVAEASTADDRLELSWSDFLKAFDDAVTDRIERHQELGLIGDFEARPIAVALNRLDASLLIHAFGRHPRTHPQTVLDAIVRIWTSTLYGTAQPAEPLAS